MCVAVVGKVIELKNARALCNFNGRFSEVSTALFPDVKNGDNVLVHSGFVSEIIKDTKKLFKTILSTDSLSLQCLDSIKRENKRLNDKKISLIIFKGPHEDSIIKYGLKDFLPKNIELICGSNCLTCKDDILNEDALKELENSFKKIDFDGVICPEYITQKLGLKAFEQWNMKFNRQFVVCKYEPIDILRAVLKILCNLNEK